MRLELQNRSSSIIPPLNHVVTLTTGRERKEGMIVRERGKRKTEKRYSEREMCNLRFP
jgi:hypothetical protein